MSTEVTGARLDDLMPVCNLSEFIQKTEQCLAAEDLLALEVASNRGPETKADIKA